MLRHVRTAQEVVRGRKDVECPAVSTQVHQEGRRCVTSDGRSVLELEVVLAGPSGDMGSGLGTQTLGQHRHRNADPCQDRGCEVVAAVLGLDGDYCRPRYVLEVVSGYLRVKGGVCPVQHLRHSRTRSPLPSTRDVGHRPNK